MGRKRNADSGTKGNDPACPEGHTLKRRVADGDFECDTCSADLASGCCFYGCEPCDYSLCGGCYVKLATGTLEVQAAADVSGSAAGGSAASQIDPDVADLCDHYAIEDRIMNLLNDALKERPATFSGDMQGLWEALSSARSPAGLLMAKIRHMKEGTFVGKCEPPPEVAKVVKQYRLDDDAKNKLTDFILKRPNTAKEDLFEIERRLEGSGKPSAVVMTMIVAIQKGARLPEIRHGQSHRDYGDLKREGGKDGDRKRDRSRDRGDRDRGDRGDRDRQRSRSRSQDRDRDRDRR
mmetsp:Transcript_86943/g.221405  ORF Transcript_86943/g.221405 Transcript_86943/m.221405 type:complete len:293 (-) Transcript_86943:65-943(-)